MPLQRSRLKNWKTLPNTIKGLIIGGYLGSLSMIYLLIAALFDPYLNNKYLIIPLVTFLFCSSFGAFIGSRIKPKRLKDYNNNK